MSAKPIVTSAWLSAISFSPASRRSFTARGRILRSRRSEFAFSSSTRRFSCWSCATSRRSWSRSRFLSTDETTRARSRTGSKGLFKKSSAPAAMQEMAFDSCPDPETTMTGITSRAGSDLIARSVSRPSSTGMSRSRRTRSNSRARNFPRPCSPFSASSIWRYPMASSSRRSAARMVRLSSTIKISTACRQSAGVGIKMVPGGRIELPTKGL